MVKIMLSNFTVLLLLLLILLLYIPSLPLSSSFAFTITSSYSTTTTTTNDGNLFSYHRRQKFNDYYVPQTICNTNRLTVVVSLFASRQRIRNRKSNNSPQQQQQQEQRRRRRNNNYHDDDDYNDKQTTERTVVIAYNKPTNVLTTHSDSEAAMSTIIQNTKNNKYNDTIIRQQPRQTVYNDIQSLNGWVGWSTFTSKNSDEKEWTSSSRTRQSFEKITGIQSKLHAIGRLDCDTTGLLLLTNDGKLVHHVTNPNSDYSSSSNKFITKTYEAVIMGYHNNDCIGFEQMRHTGVDIGSKYGGMTLPVNELIVLDYPTSKTTLVMITISEGKNRQIRRMFHSIGSGVIRLKRIKIGTQLTLIGIDQPGQWRILSDDEVLYGLDWYCRPI